MSRWRTARVASLEHPAAGLVRLRLDVDDWPGHRPGQHAVVRLRAEDGYTAQRSYSIASAPSDPAVELLVERLPDGEVSGHLHGEARVGDVVEVNGPVGRWFVWDGTSPAIAIVGGTGVVPAVSMLRHARDRGTSGALRVVAVAKTWEALPYASELRAAGAFVALTRENLDGRVAAPPYPDEVAPLLDALGDDLQAFVCGSTGFVGWATRTLREQGVPESTIRVEQFGVTG